MNNQQPTQPELSSTEIIDKGEDSVVKHSFQQLKKVKEEYSEPQIDYIIRTVAPTLNKEECYLFILRCEKLQVDPMSGDITAYVSVDKKGNRKLTMIVARNWKRERGMSNPHVKSITVEAIYTKEITEVAQKIASDGKTIEHVEVKKTVRVDEWAGGTLWGAVCTIFRDDYIDPFIVSAPLKEYKGWNVWESKPSTMIKKVAESQCWDMAVPEVSRVYDESERFDQDDKKTLTVENGSSKPTPEQIKTLESLDYQGDEPTTKQEAAEIIKKLAVEGQA